MLVLLIYFKALRNYHNLILIPIDIELSIPPNLEGPIINELSINLVWLNEPCDVRSGMKLNYSLDAYSTLGYFNSILSFEGDLD